MLIKKIAHKYGDDFELDIENFDIPANTVIGLVGKNGAGKTTLMSAISKFLKPNLDCQINYEKDDYKILFIPSEAEAYDFLTVEEFLRMVKKYSDTSLEIEQMLDILELRDKRKCSIEELSQGMKKKLTLIPLFTQKYDLIVLDEPFNSIDMNYIYKLKGVIRKLKMESSILISSHIIETLVDLCDNFTLISDGKIVKSFNNSNDINAVEGEIFERCN